MQVRRYGELAGSFAAFMQQASYITLVSVGAYIAISGHDLTMGALIASSILSGRILAPIAALPGLMVQWPMHGRRCSSLRTCSPCRRTTLGSPMP